MINNSTVHKFLRIFAAFIFCGSQSQKANFISQNLISQFFEKARNHKKILTIKYQSLKTIDYFNKDKYKY